MLGRCFGKHRLLRLEEDQRAPFSLKLRFFDDFFQIHFYITYIHDPQVQKNRSRDYSLLQQY